jgi:ABC-type lipoprotein release transport system permease subunit
VGRTLLVWRLVRADLRRRRSEAALLLLAITATTTTLTLGLVLHGVTADPYQQTRAATAGPDVVATASSPLNGPVTPADLTSLNALAQTPGVTAHSGPYPLTWAALGARGLQAGAEVMGRDQTPAAVDQPKLTQGSWIRTGGAVLEASFAQALGIHTGDSITLNGRSFPVVGVAVTAAIPPYPQVCTVGCDLELPQLSPSNTGLIWLTQADARSLATAHEQLTYLMNLKLADPARADAFAQAFGSNSHTLTANSWQYISQQDANLVAAEQQALLAGSWLLGVLAIASVAVLVGGRMADQIRRVGLLKAVGGTPGLVAAVLLAEYLFLALLAALAGLLLGRLSAPLLTKPGSGLLGNAGSPALTATTVAIVVAVALTVAVTATLIPAIRAAHISTVRALADSTHPPRRTAWLVAISARLPVPLLLGLRIAARRPRRLLLSTVSVAISVTGVVAVLTVNARNTQHFGNSSGLNNPWTNQVNQLLLLITVMLILLAGVNAIFITWATALDARRALALARALGATPQQVTAAISAAQTLPALAGALIGIPAGKALIAAVNHGATMTHPPLWPLLAVIPGTMLVIASLTAIPSRLAARRSIAEILQAELA